MADASPATLQRQPLASLLPPPPSLYRLGGNLGLVEPASQLLLSGAPDDAAFRLAVEGALGFALPGPGGHGGLLTYALWQAPDRWLVVGDEEAGLAARLAGATAGLTCLISDVTDGLAVFEIEGDWARALLAQGTGLDLSPDRFGPGQAAPTLFAGLPVTLYNVGTPQRFRLHGERASVRFLWNWLITGATAYLPPEAAD